MRIACRAVFLDAAGVIVLPHRELVTAALARAGVEIEGSTVARAHYQAVRRLDRDPGLRGMPGSYPRALCGALGVADERLTDAVAAISQLADREISGKIMWSEAAPRAQRTIAALGRAGIAVLVVTNSDGHAAENLRDAAICQTTGGAGVPIVDVIDSARVGSAKPHARIFRLALRRAGVSATSVVHVGDMLCTDVAGPERQESCRSTSTPAACAGPASTGTSARWAGSGDTSNPRAPVGVGAGDGADMSANAAVPGGETDRPIAYGRRTGLRIGTACASEDR